MHQIENPSDFFALSYNKPAVLKKKEFLQLPTSKASDYQLKPRTTIGSLFDEIPDDDEPAELVSRKDWGAREPKKPGKKIKTPVKLLVLKYGTKSPPCESKEECIKVIQEIQRRHMDEMGMRDIGYNFLVSSDGTIYEGRGWTTRTKSYPVKDERYRKLNKRSIDVVFIGTWTEQPPLSDMVSAVADLMAEGERKGYVHPQWQVFEPSRIRKPIIRHPVVVKSKKEEKYSSNRAVKWWNSMESGPTAADTYFKQPKMYTRQDWGAREPRRKVLMRTPVIYFVFRRVDTEECYTKEECSKIIRELQDRAMDEKGLPDIEYNFLIGSDGSIYEGRGWHTAPEPFPRNRWEILYQLNIRALFVGMLGENEEERETQKQEFAVIHLIEDGCAKNLVSDNSQYLMWEEIAYTRDPYDDDPA